MTVQSSPARNTEHVAPPVDGDFYRIADLLDAKERVVAVKDFHLLLLAGLPAHPRHRLGDLG